MQHGYFEFQILVDGVPVREHRQDGKTYMLAHRGREFTLLVRNDSATRVEVVAAVDGLSVMDGKLAGDSMAGGYIAGPRARLKIPGFRLDNSEVAKFTFVGGQASYAAITGASTEIGVVGVRIYAEQSEVRHPSPAAHRLGQIMRSANSQEGVGTGFGSRADHKVTEVSFKRGALLAEMVAEYDDEAGFAASGIMFPVERRAKVAFPRASGCKPPTGWPG